ncbi:hypothetical protein PAPYR_2862 [Paratrimastix pyriformis]|uniref:ditrans,polycis-polyprenyl diphosphate synthase [(2E,6E)-farnesyldiphosphate specific] n=1 Tax=Paratrimastix pyriformis TaxID=342808 RepID=A0ABQ8URB2_9EUKA|nr:hypothetical protein PAPYR_2862 [Paratrimastix pyriformis]
MQLLDRLVSLLPLLDSVPLLAARIFLIVGAFLCCILLWTAAASYLLKTRWANLRVSPKIPRWMGLSMDLSGKPNTNSIAALESIIRFSVSLGIPFLTIYDASGWILEHHLELVHHLAEQGVPSKIESSEDITITTTPTTSSDPCQVHLISTRHSYFRLLECAQATATQDPASITPDSFFSFLQPAMPDQCPPEMECLLCLGSPGLSLQAMPPWLVRSCEILACPPLHRFGEADFVSAMTRFCGCVQRHGK